MNKNSNHYWKKSFNTTRVDVVIDDPLKILDTYITNFKSPYRIDVFDKIKDDFVKQNDETYIQRLSTTLSTGVSGGTESGETVPQMFEKWRQIAQDIPGLWEIKDPLDNPAWSVEFPCGEEQFDFPFWYFWKPGSRPFDIPSGGRWRTFLPAGLRNPKYIRDGDLYQFPSEVPPYGTEPLYVDEQTGQEIYYYPPGQNGHYWSREILTKPPALRGRAVWHFKPPISNPGDFTIPDWIQFDPCFGIPICWVSVRDYPDGPPRFIPDPVEDPAPGRLDPGWGNYPYQNKPEPPSFWTDENPYGIPQEGTCPDCPTGPAAPLGPDPSDNPFGIFRPIRIPGKNNPDGSPLYYPRGWNPFLGPTVITPSGEEIPVNPNFVSTRPDQQPCNTNGPGFSPLNQS